jgi:hypothetical protein
MRGRGDIAGLPATCVAVALSGPAHADLRHDLRNGVTPSVVLGTLQRTGSAPAESAIILMSAVNNMCPTPSRRLSAGRGKTVTPGRCKGFAPCHAGTNATTGGEIGQA